jgi:hypothetical protein
MPGDTFDLNESSARVGTCAQGARLDKMLEANKAKCVRVCMPETFIFACDLNRDRGLGGVH